MSFPFLSVNVWRVEWCEIKHPSVLHARGTCLISAFCLPRLLALAMLFFSFVLVFISAVVVVAVFLACLIAFLLNTCYFLTVVVV